MSFNDVGGSRSSVTSSSSIKSTNVTNTLSNGSSSVNTTDQRDPLYLISDHLQMLQKICVTLKDKITEMKRRRVSALEKSELDSKLKELKNGEKRLKQKFDSQFKALDSLPRADSAQKRLALNKLQKDSEKLGLLIQRISSEGQSIKASLTNGSAKETEGFGNLENYEGNDNANGDRMIQSKKNLITLKEVDVDTMIIEERERDIQKINKDIVLVHEMFRDMAVLVEKQGEQIDTIATTTDQSHAKAQEGLEQIKQAAQHQSSCSIS